MAQQPPPEQPSPQSPPPPATSPAAEPPKSDFPPPPESTCSPSFDPSRMIGIIKRKALIKKLAAVYHAECLSYSQQLLDFQSKSQEPFVDLKTIPDHHDSRKESIRPPTKRYKKR